MSEDEYYDKVESGEQCFSCHCDIDGGEARGFPRVCDSCLEDGQ